MPPGVCTWMATLPSAVPGGLVVVIVVSSTTWKLGAATVPKRTALAPVKPLPMRVTRAPPPSAPWAG